MAGKKILLLLDDAAGHEQVRPLLPGTAGSLVLVTSRRHLTALEDAAAISLDTLAPGEAAALLARLAGRPGLGAGDAAVGEITRLCGYLPLAIGMLARQLHHHPAWTAAELAADLAAARDRLELMRAENLSVAAAFDLSYQDLTAGPAAAVPPPRPASPAPTSTPTPPPPWTAPAWPPPAATWTACTTSTCSPSPPAAATGCTTCSASTPARWPPPATRPTADAAAGRLLDYYLHTAAAAGQHIATRPTARGRPPPGRPPACRPAAVHRSGRRPAWLDAERPNLHAAAGYAAASGRPRHAIAIPAAISGFLFARGHWDQAAALHQTALTAARQAGDRPGAGRCAQRAGHPAASDRGLPGRRRQPDPGAGAVPRPGRPARPGQRPQPPGPACSR